MSEYSVGFFVIPGAHCEELRRVEEEADHALDTNEPDQLWRINQIFHRAREVAVVAEIITGESEPFVDDGRDIAYIHLSLWIKERLLDGNRRHALDVEQFLMLTDRLQKALWEEFWQWSAAHVSEDGEVAASLLEEVFDALQRAIQAAPCGPHGFVYTNFRHEFAEPPPEPPEPTISLADGRKRAELLNFRIQARIRRQRRPWWVDAPHEEARVLLGLLAPDRVDELAEAYRRAMELLTGDEVRAGLTALNDGVIPQVEAALIDPIIETVGGPVEALRCLEARLRWETKETPPAIYSPEEAVEFDELLDRHLDDEALDWIYGEERHWTRALVCETCEKFREALGRALATGYGFAWLIDEFRT